MYSRGRHHKRVLYIDIDIHHGDGVEEAFYTTVPAAAAAATPAARAHHTGDGARATPPGHRSRARALSSPRRRTA